MDAELIIGLFLLGFIVFFAIGSFWAMKLDLTKSESLSKFLILLGVTIIFGNPVLMEILDLDYGFFAFGFILGMGLIVFSVSLAIAKAIPTTRTEPTPHTHPDKRNEKSCHSLWKYQD